MKTKLFIVLLFIAFITMASECNGGGGDLTKTPPPIPVMTIEIICPNGHTNGYDCIMVTPEP